MILLIQQNLLNLIEKEELDGEELAILLNHLIKNIKLDLLNEKHKEILGDKIKYGEQEGE